MQLFFPIRKGFLASLLIACPHCYKLLGFTVSQNETDSTKGNVWDVGVYQKRAIYFGKNQPGQERARF